MRIIYRLDTLLLVSRRSDPTTPVSPLSLTGPPLLKYKPLAMHQTQRSVLTSSCIAAHASLVVIVGSAPGWAAGVQVVLLQWSWRSKSCGTRDLEVNIHIWLLDRCFTSSHAGL